MYDIRYDLTFYVILSPLFQMLVWTMTAWWCASLTRGKSLVFCLFSKPLLSWTRMRNGRSKGDWGCTITAWNKSLLMKLSFAWKSDIFASLIRCFVLYSFPIFLPACTGWSLQPQHWLPNYHHHTSLLKLSTKQDFHKELPHLRVF